MKSAHDQISQDRFLGGRVSVAQPKSGFRAGHDTVLVAAAVPARAGERVLELGSGAGVASLCLAARVAECEVMGIEINEDLVLMANISAARNNMGARARFVVGDVLDAPIDGAPFDHVFFNPPFHPESAQASPSAERDLAMRGDDIADWNARARALVKPGGTVTAIVRADRVEEFPADGGALTVLPLLPHESEPPKRVIVQLRVGDEGAPYTMPPLVLHQADGKPTDAVEAVLRYAMPLEM